MLTSRVYVLTGAVNGWLENSSPEQYSCNLMSTRQKTMRLRVHCAKTRSMFEPLDTDIKTRTRKCEVVYCIAAIIKVFSKNGTRRFEIIAKLNYKSTVKCRFNNFRHPCCERSSSCCQCAICIVSYQMHFGICLCCWLQCRCYD